MRRCVDDVLVVLKLGVIGYLFITVINMLCVNLFFVGRKKDGWCDKECTGWNAVVFEVHRVELLSNGISE
jgi:hypothetical protein